MRSATSPCRRHFRVTSRTQAVRGGRATQPSGTGSVPEKAFLGPGHVVARSVLSVFTSTRTAVRGLPTRTSKAQDMDDSRHGPPSKASDAVSQPPSGAMNGSVARAFFAWFFQLAASVSWVVSVIIYNSYETGDIFQFLAALCWTVSNGLAMPEAVLPLFAGRRQTVTTVRRADGDQV